ncbi:hypothetical protein HanRHA438_Chr17g0825271 [Helianthus annuus]|nr:hypothetical protein HanRHA438_Chr17g0825271 [Helianthus annuus]
MDPSKQVACFLCRWSGLLNKGGRKKVRVVETRREWRNYTVVNIMALEFKSGDSDVTG